MSTPPNDGPESVPSPVPQPTAATAAVAAAPRSRRTDPPKVRWGDLVIGIPAALVSLAMVGTLYQGIRRTDLPLEYAAETERLSKAGDIKAVAVVLKRMVAMSPERPDFRLGLAMAYERIGEAGRAESLMRALAPADRPGYPPAQLWLARKIVGSAGLTQQRLDLAIVYLKRYLDANPNSIEVKAMLGTLYGKIGRLKEARPLLDAVAPGHPDILVDLAAICKMMGDREDSRRYAKAALEICNKVGPNYPDDLNLRLYWAKALTLLDDFAGGLEVLEKARTPEKARAVMRKNKAALLVAWDETLELAKGDPAKRLEVVELGLAIDPDNPALFVRLATLMSTTEEIREKVRTRLATMEKQKQAPALVAFTIGNDAWERGEIDEARKRWEVALALQPNLALAANNLAWCLAFKEPRDPPRALSLVESALKAVPGDPRVHGTRGQVLTRLGRWKDAIPDLELAINAGQATKSIHESLADAYEHLGMANLAAEQRLLAK